MQLDDWGVVGALLTAVAGLAAWFTGRDNRIEDAMSTEVSALHDKINKVKDDYVRRDDLAVMLGDIKEGQRQISAKVDRLIEQHHKPGAEHP